jgi:hypothetical protein
MPKDTASQHSWRALRPTDAARLFASSKVPWWIAGGWALDVFRGTPSRPHTDLDVGILRRDALTVLHCVSAWEVFEAEGGRLSPLPPGRVPRLDVHSLWCRPTATDHWTIELMLDESDGETWVYRREPRIRRPMSTAVRQSPEGLPYLAPEIQLLYKSKAPRERDELDFLHTCRLLVPEARRWLRDALELVQPDHQWIAALASTGSPTAISLRTSS